MGPDSDLDLLVVKSNVHRRATAQMIEQSLIGINIPTDIVVATPEDIELHKDTIGLLYRPALREGKVIYAAQKERFHGNTAGMAPAGEGALADSYDLVTGR